MTTIARRARGEGARIIACALTLGLLVISVPGRTDPAEGPAGTQVQEEVTVALKLVQAYVTTKDGRPVTDLTAADFEVTDNGHKMAVTHFEKHLAGGDDIAPGGPLEAPQLSRKFFLFFDFAFTDARSTRKAREAALEFMDAALKAGDEVGVLSYSPMRGLTIHEYLTTDHAKVRNIVDAFGLRAATGRAESLTNYLYADEVMWMLDDEQPDAPDTFFREQARAQSGGVVDEGRRQGYIDQARQFAQTFTHLGQALRYVPGWKNLILFSSGISRSLIYGERRGLTAPIIDPSNPEATAAALSAYDNAQSNSGVRTEFSEALKALKTSNSPIYAIDCAARTGEMDINNPIGTSISSREVSGKDSLVQLAGESGGKYFSNTMDTGKALAEIEDITSSFYVLGYSVPAAWDGAFHKIKVKVGRPGCKVVSQTGYYNPKPFREHSAFERLLQMTDLALSDNPLGRLPEETPLAAMPVVVGGWTHLVAYAGLPKEAAAGIVGKRANAYLIIYDEEQGRTAIKSFRVKPPTGGPKDSIAVFALPLKPGRYSLRLIVQNAETGMAARGSGSLTFADPIAASIWIDTPLLLEPGHGWADLGAPPESTLPALFGYDPGEFAPVTGELAPGPRRLAAALRLSLGMPDVELDITATDSLDGIETEIPVTVLETKQERSLRTCLIELPFADLKPGLHTLTIAARDKAGIEGNETTTTFTVR
ncbi:MAG TPA: VWA domain-containing protein [Candidatus Aminicenantes bacterium]|nr:VWA domain-containing protein [Candidatus Aminicenantes bacterium]HDT14545.1 VWA domain-containing protein [Candidatus Aminicenantes bacterium]